MYTIRRCIQCGSYVHVHKKDNHYVFKKSCTHIPDKERFTNKDIDTYLRRPNELS